MLQHKHTDKSKKWKETTTTTTKQKKKQSIREFICKNDTFIHISPTFLAWSVNFRVYLDMKWEMICTRETYFLEFYLIAWVKSMALLLVVLLPNVLFAAAAAAGGWVVMMMLLPLQLGMCCFALDNELFLENQRQRKNTKFELKLTPESKRHNRLVHSSSKVGAKPWDWNRWMDR